MATFVISKRLNGFYKYELTSRKGKPIFTSNDFELRFECEEEIKHLQESLEKIIFLRFKSGKGKFYFRIVLNEKEIAISRKFSTQLLLEKSINEISKYTDRAEVLDFSSSGDVFPDGKDVFF
jgi:uncharacterized protein YegP (UPF0339 family)